MAARPQGGDRLGRRPLAEPHGLQELGIADGLGDPLGHLHVRAQLGALGVAGDVRLVLRRVLLVVLVVVRPAETITFCRGHRAPPWAAGDAQRAAERLTAEERWSDLT